MDSNDFHVFFFIFTEMEVRASLVGSGNMISICTCLTQLDQNFVQSFGVFLLDHILLIVLRYLSDEPTVNFSSSVLTPFYRLLQLNCLLRKSSTFNSTLIMTNNFFFSSNRFVKVQIPLCCI